MIPATAPVIVHGFSIRWSFVSIARRRTIVQLIMLLACAVTLAIAQEPTETDMDSIAVDVIADRSRKIAAYPYAFYTPETELAMSNLKYSYGLGIRLLFNSRDTINLRADLGFGEDTRGVYFGLEEAF